MEQGRLSARGSVLPPFTSGEPRYVRPPMPRQIYNLDDPGRGSHEVRCPVRIPGYPPGRSSFLSHYQRTDPGHMTRNIPAAPVRGSERARTTVTARCTAPVSATAQLSIHRKIFFKGSSYCEKISPPLAGSTFPAYDVVHIVHYPHRTGPHHFVRHHAERLSPNNRLPVPYRRHARGKVGPACREMYIWQSALLNSASCCVRNRGELRPQTNASGGVSD